MKGLSEYVSSVYDGTMGRESIEWANIWYSEANLPTSKDRILLIGDSTARMIRSTFQRMIGKPVDMLGTSCSLHDILFLKQLDALFASKYYHYSHIFIQMGHHSIRGESGLLYGEGDYIRFHQDYVALINFLSHYCKNIILLTCFLNVSPLPPRLNSTISSIPILLYRKVFGEKIDYSWSDVVIRKNKIIEEIAKLLDLQFCDIDGIMRAKCDGMFPKYIHNDHIHYFGRRAKTAIAREYAKLLRT